MPRNQTSQVQNRANVEESTDRRLVEVLESTVEREVLRRLEKPLHIVVHEAVVKAIAEASKVVAPANETDDTAITAKDMGIEEPHRPRAGGRCAAVWDELDHMRQEGAVPSLKEILAIGRRRRWNPNNTRIEYYQWRRFQGIHGRVGLQRGGRWLDRRVNPSAPRRGAPERRASM